MAVGCGSASAWKDEELEGWEDGVDGIYLCLNGCDHLGGDDVACAHFVLGVVGGEVAAYDEKLALDIGEEGLVGGICAVCDEHSDVAVELIYCAV